MNYRLPESRMTVNYYQLPCDRDHRSAMVQNGLQTTTTIEIALLCTVTDLIKALITVNTGMVLPLTFDD